MAKKGKSRRRGYRILTERQKNVLRRKASDRKMKLTGTGSGIKGRIPSYELGQLFGGIPQTYRRGFAKDYSVPKSKKGRSEFRVGILDAYLASPGMRPK